MSASTRNGEQIKRFRTAEIILHWAQGLPFLILLTTGGLLLLSRFTVMDRATFALLKTIHLGTAVTWVTLVIITFLFINPKVHLRNLRQIFTWGVADLKWMVLSFRCLFSSSVEIPDAPKFNTGQKINCLLVIVYFFGFAATGSLMWFRGSMLIAWYLHASLFFAALSSVAGHLYLSFINPSTRVGLGGIFHGWVPKEYIEHHHALTLADLDIERRNEGTLGYRAQTEGPKDIKKMVGSYMKAEIIFLIITLVLGGAGLKIFNQGKKASLKQGFNNIIRPNELSGAHRTKEIGTDCTKCHEYAGELKDEKCLACHKIIKERLDGSIGYHGTLKGKKCMQCHKEHPVFETSIIPFDPQKFDHNLAQFKLEGKHANPQLKCGECHKKNRTKEDPGIYYIGVRFQACIDCHKDPHQTKLGDNCLNCHSVMGWQGKELKFDHNRDSKYKLEGRHEKVECIKCHKPALANGPLGTAIFRGLGTTCQTCHKDPHTGKLGEDCLRCHSVNGWKGLQGATTTQSTATSTSSSTSASSSPSPSVTPRAATPQVAPVSRSGGQLQGASNLKFDHNRDSKYKLDGKHEKAACDKCHKPTKSGSLASAVFRGLPTTCPSCHKDPHNNQLGDNCQKCHSTNDWRGKEVRFSHNTDSKYKLDGKHEKLDCTKCHKPAKENGPLGTAQFKGLKFDKCQACHKDPHNAQLGDNCQKCHSTTDWRGKDVRFNHNTDSKYKLEGKHEKVDCKKCHKPAEPNGTLATALFKGIKFDNCDSCHKDPHKGDYGQKCLHCHTINGWPKKEPAFSHDQDTKYGLAGKHDKVKCLDCHNQQRVNSIGPMTLEEFKNNCGLCHKDPHSGQLDPKCKKCHAPIGWKDKELLFKHNVHSKYKIDNLHARVKCHGCHKNKQYKPLSSECESCHQQATIPGQRR